MNITRKHYYYYEYTQITDSVLQKPNIAMNAYCFQNMYEVMPQDNIPMPLLKAFTLLTQNQETLTIIIKQFL